MATKTQGTPNGNEAVFLNSELATKAQATAFLMRPGVDGVRPPAKVRYAAGYNLQMIEQLQSQLEGRRDKFLKAHAEPNGDPMSKSEYQTILVCRETEPDDNGEYPEVCRGEEAETLRKAEAERREAGEEFVSEFVFNTEFVFKSEEDEAEFKEDWKTAMEDSQTTEVRRVSAEAFGEFVPSADQFVTYHTTYMVTE